MCQRKKLCLKFAIANRRNEMSGAEMNGESAIMLGKVQYQSNLNKRNVRTGNLTQKKIRTLPLLELH